MDTDDNLGARRVTGLLQRVARVQRTRSAGALARLGLYPGQDLLLATLLPTPGHSEGMTPGELAARLGVRAPTVTKTLHRLEAQGLLERRPSRLDGRVSIVVLTPEGEDKAGRLKSLWKKEEKRALDGVEVKDRKRLLKVLAQIEANLAEEE